MSEVYSAGAGRREVITLGGGCFWCIEAVFDEIKGVEKVESGYSGGHVARPTYAQVCSGDTGHAEVVEVTFDPDVLAFAHLMQVFFAVHDPTTLNRQGADMGTQYRSVVFYRSPEQKAAAEKAIAAAQREWRDPIVTQLEPFKAFYRAEDYHQEYFRLNGQQPYCQFVIAPKMSKVRKQFKAWLKP